VALKYLLAGMAQSGAVLQQTLLNREIICQLLTAEATCISPAVRSAPDAWPGSRSIAIAKASTANDFSNSQKALSTANLYSFTQPANTNTSNVPAGSLYGLNNSNPFNPAFQPQGTGVGSVPGGIITFGGGVPLYSNGQVIGGLG